MTQRVPGCPADLWLRFSLSAHPSQPRLGDNPNRLVVKIFFAMYSSLPPLFSIQPARRSHSMPSA